MNWKNVDPATPLSPHFTFGEFLAGHGAGYLDTIKWTPGRILPVIAVAEFARDLYGELVGKIKPLAGEHHPVGIMVSSGLRLRGSARAPKSKHTLGEALDMRPAGNWKACKIATAPDRVYDLFYGCFVKALAHFEEPFGLGYYPRSMSGIHVDAGFGTRERQNKRDGLARHGIRGWRWSHSYSWRVDSDELLRLHKRFSPKNLTRQPWEYFAEIFKINLQFPK